MFIFVVISAQEHRDTKSHEYKTNYHEKSIRMKLLPLSDHVFIQSLEEEKQTPSGIVIPDTAEKEKPVKGKVIAVGPGRRNEKGELVPMSVKVGNIVLFKKYGPDEIELTDANGKKVEYLVASEEDILAILE